MAGWVEVPGAEGRPFLMNLANVLGFQKGSGGEAIVISIAGAGVVLTEQYDTVAGEAMNEGDG